MQRHWRGTNDITGCGTMVWPCTDGDTTVVPTARRINNAACTGHVLRDVARGVQRFVHRQRMGKVHPHV